MSDLGTRTTSPKVSSTTIAFGLKPLASSPPSFISSLAVINCPSDEISET